MQPVRVRERSLATRWLIAVVALVLVAGGMIGGYVLFGASGPDHPDEWDPLVVELVDFIEAARRIPFEYPVHVHFLEPSEYRALAAGDVDDPEADDPEAVDRDERELATAQQVAMFRSLGLVSGELDLDESARATMQEGTAAFYSTVDEQVYVNGTPDGDELPADLRLTVVHELAHAWQHQQMQLRGAEIAAADATSEETDAMRAVLEGDATVLERRYANRLNETERQALVAAEHEAAESAREAMAASGAGDLVPLLFSLPYLFGPSWAENTLNHGGDTAVVDALVDDLPSTASILSVSPDSAPVRDVDEPDLAGDRSEIMRDTWGALTWLVPLAGATDAMTARLALDGWTGDSVLVSSGGVDGRDDVVCVDANVSFDAQTSASAFEAAGSSWLAQLPAEANASMQRSGDVVTLHTCDPGSDVEVALDGDAAAAIEELALINSFAASLALDGAPVATNICIGHGLVNRWGLDTIVGDGPQPSAEEARAAWMQLTAFCS